MAVSILTCRILHIFCRILRILHIFCRRRQIFTNKRTFSSKARHRWRRCLRRQFFQKNDPLLLKSEELPCGAASGGDFSQKMIPFSLKVRNSLAALPPAAIFPEKILLSLNVRNSLAALPPAAIFQENGPVYIY